MVEHAPFVFGFLALASALMAFCHWVDYSQSIEDQHMSYAVRVLMWFYVYLSASMIFAYGSWYFA